MTISPAALGAVGVTATLIVFSAAAAPTDADFRVDIGITTTLTAAPSAFPAIPNGGTATVASRNFLVGVRVRLIPAQAESATMRLELSEGLSWGADKPATTANCTGTTRTAECQTMPITADPAGDTEEHFGWDVVAARFGRYTVKAEIVGGSAPDPIPSNNTASVNVVVAEFTGGGTRTTTAGVAKVSPAHPKAGSLVLVTVRVVADGPPVRPKALRCAGTIGRAELGGTPRASSGAATCRYRPPLSAKGKTLRGVISFRAQSKGFVRRFSARLG